MLTWQLPGSRVLKLKACTTVVEAGKPQNIPRMLKGAVEQREQMGCFGHFSKVQPDINTEKPFFPALKRVYIFQIMVLKTERGPRDLSSVLGFAMGRLLVLREPLCLHDVMRLFWDIRDNDTDLLCKALRDLWIKTRA